MKFTEFTSSLLQAPILEQSKLRNLLLGITSQESNQNQNTMKKILLFLLLAFSGTFFGQPGTNDPSFNPTDLGFGSGVGPNTSVLTTSQQSDGKTIVGGNFITYN